MARYGLVIDLNFCTGCYNCQIACKDEHVGNDFLPVSKSQPTFGHFWMGIKELERVYSPSHIKVVYIPVLCQHCQKAPCMEMAKNNAIYRRRDGIVIIDPVKSKGQKEIVDSCPYGVIFWNEEAGIPQKCTFCAHLLDDGWKEPRCVQSCPTNCMIFGDLDRPNSKISKFLKEKKVEIFYPELNTSPNVYYVGLPKPHLSGTVIFGDIDECGRDVTVTLIGSQGRRIKTKTDFFGDFEFDSIEKQKYTIQFDVKGYESKTIEVVMEDDICYVGEIVLNKV